MSTESVRLRLRRSLDGWPAVAVVSAFLLSTLLLPRAEVPVGDDWFYARTVQLLVDGEGFHILDATVVTLVLPALWGALFAVVFGTSFVVLRWSTLTLVAGGGVAVYALCRTLGVGRRSAALAAAVVLFDPLAYVLGNSFMSDAPFTAVLAVAAFLYVRGLAVTGERPRTVVLASAAAAAAFLVRQQGALIPIAVVLHLLVLGRVKFDRAGLWTVARVAGLPALTGVAYLAWLRLVHGVPASQDMFVEEVRFLFEPSMVDLAARLVVIGFVYSGLFALPVALVAFMGLPRALASLPRRAAPVAVASTLVIVLGVAWFSREDQRMPYVEQYLTEWGLGPADLVGGRPIVLGHRLLALLTVACALAAVSATVLVARAVAGGPRRLGAGGAALLLSILAGQAAGMVPPSLHFQNPVPAAVLVPTLDRYLLPLLPLVVCLVVWSTADLRVPSWPAWVLTAGLAVFAVAGTHDFLVFQRSVFQLAAAAERDGVPVSRLDAGAQWDAAHLYRDRVEVPPSLPGRPWWVNQFAWDLDARWVVSSTPLAGHVEERSATYGGWLPTKTERRLYLLRRVEGSG